MLFSTQAALAALSMPQTDMDDFFTKCNDGFVKKRDLVLKELEDMQLKPAVTPTGAFYVFPVIEKFFGMFIPGKDGKDDTKVENSMDLCLHILDQEKPLALVRGCTSCMVPPIMAMIGFEQQRQCAAVGVCVSFLRRCQVAPSARNAACGLATLRVRRTSQRR